MLLSVCWPSEIEVKLICSDLDGSINVLRSSRCLQINKLLRQIEDFEMSLTAQLFSASLSSGLNIFNVFLSSSSVTDAFPDFSHDQLLFL